VPATVHLDCQLASQPVQLKTYCSAVRGVAIGKETNGETVVRPMSMSCSRVLIWLISKRNNGNKSDTDFTYLRWFDLGRGDGGVEISLQCSLWSVSLGRHPGAEAAA
jgi:hypothetical protein